MIDGWGLGYVFFSAILFLGVIILLIRQLNYNATERGKLVDKLIEYADKPPMYLPMPENGPPKPNQIPWGDESDYVDYLEDLQAQGPDASAQDVEGKDG